MDISKGFFISAATLFSSKEKRASPELLSEFVLEREAHTPLCVFPASEHVSVFGGEEKYSLRGKSSLQLVLL